MGDFFMTVSAIGAVVLVFAIIAYQRAKAEASR
jgi:hypothetical protein